MNIGQVCVKTTGRDAGKRGIVLDIRENKVLIDGEVRRRLVSIMHVIPTEKRVEISREASHELVKKAMAGIGITLKDKKPKVKPEKAEAKKPAVVPSKISS